MHNLSWKISAQSSLEFRDRIGNLILAKRLDQEVVNNKKREPAK